VESNTAEINLIRGMIRFEDVSRLRKKEKSSSVNVIRKRGAEPWIMNNTQYPHLKKFAVFRTARPSIGDAYYGMKD
jgi:hypothetical protein